MFLPKRFAALVALAALAAAKADEVSTRPLYSVAPLPERHGVSGIVADVGDDKQQPLEIINQGVSSNPAGATTAIARSFYPFVAHEHSTVVNPQSNSSSAPSSFSNPSVSARSICVLYQPSSRVAQSIAFCEANPNLCTVECARVVPVETPICDPTDSGYDWTFNYEEYGDQDCSLADSTPFVADQGQTPFTEPFENSASWNTCPTTEAVRLSNDYARFISSVVQYDHLDASTGGAALAAPKSIDTPLEFGFKIFVAQDPSNPNSTPTPKMFRARLTHLEVSRHDGTSYVLVGSSVNPTIGGPGPDRHRVHGLSFGPAPISGGHRMFVHPRAQLEGSSNPEYASINVTFTPNVGSPSDPNNMLYYLDSDIPGGVTLTVTFSGVISFFPLDRDGDSDDTSSSSNLGDIHFEHQSAFPGSRGEIVYSFSSKNSTTITIEVPQLAEAQAVGFATMVGSAMCCVGVLSLFAFAFHFCKRSRLLPTSLSVTRVWEQQDHRGSSRELSSSSSSRSEK